MDSADELVPISALEHWSYCPRQCGLIHIEATYTDNVLTLRGNQAHERAHEEGDSQDGNVLIIRSLPVWSQRLGLTGKADVVEFRGDQPYPVEYKVGRRGTWGHEDIQLGAQAICLEEMLGIDVPNGAIFYRGSNRRREVAIDAMLRTAVEEAAASVRVLLQGVALPSALDDARCPNCSLNDSCLPHVTGPGRRWTLLHTALFKVTEEASEPLK